MYEWVLSAHIVSVISWMAGLLYLPRLFVYHWESETGSAQSETFKRMERRLLRTILAPAMIASWAFGVWLATIIGAWNQGWFHFKIALVVVLTVFHAACERWARQFYQDARPHSQRYFRFINEVPTLLMIAIVIMAVVKPF